MSARPLTLLFVIKDLSLAGGGAERILALVSGALARRGHELIVLTFDGAGEDFYEIGAGVRRLRLDGGSSSNPSGPLAAAGRLVRLRSIVRDLRPDVAIGFMYSAFLPLSLALAGTGIPVIGSERTSYGHYRTRPLLRLLLRGCVPLLAGMTVNGEQVRQGFPKAVASRMQVVPNPVATASGFADTAGREPRTLLAVGGLRPEKDHRTLISAFARIAGDFPDWNLRIVGGGPLREPLQAQIAALGLVGRAELAGTTGSIEQEYRAAQLFVLPSLYEAFPNCLAEALAHGLPAIGFADCAGTNDLIVPGRNGLLADSASRVDGLATALTDLMASAPLRAELGKAAPETVKKYGIAEVVGVWERLLSSASTKRIDSGADEKR